MRSKRIGVSAALGLALLVTSGCVFTPDLDKVQRMVAKEIEPATMKTQVKLNLGPVALSLTRLITRLADVEEEARGYLDHIERVEINVQEISGLSSLSSIHWPEGLERRLKREGWEIMVKVRDEEEITLVLYKSRKKTIGSMYVMSLSPDELVLVKVQGRLDAIITRALEDHAFTKGWATNVH